MSLPIIFSNASVPLVGIVDTAVMGRMDSPAYISATAIAAVIFSSLYWMFGFLQMGTSGQVAQAFGANNKRSILETTQRAALIAIIIGIVLVLFSQPIFTATMLAMRGTAELHSLTSEYYFIRVVAAPATLLLYVVQGSLIGQQRMRSVFAIQIFLNLSNVILNLWFFTYTDWNIRGVAIATVISECLALSLGLYLLRDVIFKEPQSLVQLLAREKLVAFFQLSGDLFIRTACLTFAYYWLTVMGSRQGDLVLAANAILFQMLHLMAYALDGFSTSAEALSGQAFGKKDKKALSAAIKACTEWAFGFAILFCLSYWCWGQDIINLITTQPNTQNAAGAGLVWIIWAPLLGVWSFLLDGIYIGTTRTREMRNGMLISIAVFFAATLIFIPVLGNAGLWLSYYILMIVRALTLGIWFPRIFAAVNETVLKN